MARGIARPARHRVVLCASLLGAALAVPAGAQTLPPDVSLTLSPHMQSTVTPGTGAGVDTTPINGGQEVKSVDDRLQIRPSVAQGDWSTSMEYESWAGKGKRAVGGSRTTVVAGYTRGLSPKSEVAAVVPLQWVSLDGGFGSESGVGDAELSYRHFFYDPERPDGITYTASARVFLPTGDFAKGIGLGEFSYGVSGLASRPFGVNTLGCAGVGYTIVGDPSGFSAKNVLYAWAGGVTRLHPRWSVQYEAAHFNSPADEGYTRLLVGARYALTPTRGFQLNVKQELEADGKPTAITLGYSARL